MQVRPLTKFKHVDLNGKSRGEARCGMHQNLQAIYSKSINYILVNREKNQNIPTKVRRKRKIVHSFHI